MQAAYKEATKKDLKYEINSKKFLPSDSAGGLNVSNKNGSIIVSCYPISIFFKIRGKFSKNIFRSKIHWKSVLPCFQNKVYQKCEMNFLGQIQTESFWIKKFHVSSPFRHHWCHQYSSHKLAIISQWNVVLSHYLFSTITVIYVLQSSIWLILMIHKFWVMHWVIAVFYLYIDHCHEHVSWTVAIHNILHRNCAFFLIYKSLK